MSLRDRLGISAPGGPGRDRWLFERYGVVENPFPPASQPMGHPHKSTTADEKIEQRLKTFLADKTTQVVVVEGTQGTGKTNILEYYQRELSEIFGGDSRFYIIRYYADPEPEFAGVVRRIVQEFGIEGLKELGRRFQAQLRFRGEKERILSVVRGHETRQAFLRLAQAAETPEALDVTAQLLLEYLLGLRTYKRHTEALGVQFRLDTTEAKIQALHDLVYFGRQLGCVEAIFLFLDELEKQGGLPAALATRYLSSIRALIDALPDNLFLVLAMTTEARSRYRLMLPALAERLQATVTLSPLVTDEEAVGLWEFYVAEMRKLASESTQTRGWNPGQEPILDVRQVQTTFRDLRKQADQRGSAGVTPRGLLDALHSLAELQFSRS